MYINVTFLSKNECPKAPGLGAGVEGVGWKDLGAFCFGPGLASAVARKSGLAAWERIYFCSKVEKQPALVEDDLLATWHSTLNNSKTADGWLADCLLSWEVGFRRIQLKWVLDAMIRVCSHGVTRLFSPAIRPWGLEEIQKGSGQAGIHRTERLTVLSISQIARYPWWNSFYVLGMVRSGSIWVAFQRVIFFVSKPFLFAA